MLAPNICFRYNTIIETTLVLAIKGTTMKDIEIYPREFAPNLEIDFETDLEKKLSKQGIDAINAEQLAQFNQVFNFWRSPSSNYSFLYKKARTAFVELLSNDSTQIVAHEKNISWMDLDRIAQGFQKLGFKTERTDNREEQKATHLHWQMYSLTYTLKIFR